MIKLDVSQLPSTIATILMLRGAELPPVQLNMHPNRNAKGTLDGLRTPNELFGQTPVVDQGMANAVRALLFLWNGWMDDCVKAAESAPEKERLYIQALCDRAEGEPAAAKSSFQKLEAHVVFPKLTAYATEAITTGASGQVKRLLDMIQMTQEWEAYTFVDLIELARADKLDSAGEQIVRQLQCREFELLFAHCFEGATGEAIKETEAVTVAHKRRPQAAPSTRRRPASTPASTTSASKPTPSKTPSAGPPPKDDRSQRTERIGVYCPKCQHSKILSAARRGTKERCEKCDAVFLIPGGPSTATAKQ